MRKIQFWSLVTSPEGMSPKDHSPFTTYHLYSILSTLNKSGGNESEVRRIIHHLPFTIHHLYSILSTLNKSGGNESEVRRIIYHLPLTIYHLPFTISTLYSLISHLLYSLCFILYALHFHSTFFYHLTFTIHHLPLI